ncbi:MAG: ATP-binding protein [Burkholderiales bacterium]|nr:ATP-binding protein [Burkholderiales bacterium]
MDIDLVKSLPLGTSSFAKLRRTGQIYVDKTELIYKLASLDQKFLLVRPRRFGKSLLVSTFASLFKYGLRDFKGLAIENLWKEDKLYPVATIDLSLAKNFQTKDEFAIKLQDVLAGAFSRIGFVYDARSNLSLYSQLTIWLRKTLPLGSLVLLIDEYDAPLTTHLSQPELFNEARDELSGFFTWIKASDEALRFLFLTGITKFSKASIFSELNFLDDISLLPEFGTLLGYTFEELVNYFDEQLVEASTILKTSKDDLLKALEYQYDGFCFDQNAEKKVFPPWSVLNFLASPNNGFQNYWVGSSGDPTVLHEYLKGHALRYPSDYLKPQFIGKSELERTSTDPRHFNDLVLLTQAGYLTIKSSLDDAFELGYPNQEVADSFAQIYRAELLSHRTLASVGAPDILSLIETGDVDGLFDTLNKVLLALDYTKFPIRDEATCRCYLQLILTLGEGITTYAELHNALGRSDVELETSRTRWVFELKFLAKGKETAFQINQSLEEAVNQIKLHRYGESDLSQRHLLRIGAVYSEKERKFVKWEVVG